MAVTKTPLAQYRPHKDANIHVRKGASNHPLHACTIHPRLFDKRDASADSTCAGSEDTSPQHNSEQSRRAGHAADDGNGRADMCAGPCGPAAVVCAAWQRLWLCLADATAPVLLAATTEMRCCRQKMPMRGAGKKARRNAAGAKELAAVEAASSCASSAAQRCTLEASATCAEDPQCKR